MAYANVFYKLKLQKGIYCWTEGGEQLYFGFHNGLVSGLKTYYWVEEGKCKRVYEYQLAR